MSKNAALQALDILIVDDEADIRELVAGILSDEGYNTRLAGDSDGALRETRSRRPRRRRIRSRSSDRKT